MGDLEPVRDAPITFDVAFDGGDTAIITIAGELDIATIDALDQLVTATIAKRPTRLIVDVAGLRFADSSAIALWVRWSTAVRDFELRDPPPLLRRVITAMGLTQKLTVTP